MDTSRDALLSLLELQRVDSAIARLEARLGHLPEQAALEALEARLSELDEEIRRRRVALDEVATRQRRLDFEVDSLSQKIAGEVERLYSGKIGSPKELSDLSREVEALKRRRVVLEDNDLEVMEEREGAEKELNALLDERAGIVREIEEARVRRDTASGDVGSQLSAAHTERQRWAPRIDPGLLHVYDEIRTARGGIGAAAMVDGVCQGCHMRLPAQEAERVRSAEGLIRCDECRRILVVL